jgi:hypothetical protein
LRKWILPYYFFNEGRKYNGDKKKLPVEALGLLETIPLLVPVERNKLINRSEESLLSYNEISYTEHSIIIEYLFLKFLPLQLKREKLLSKWSNTYRPIRLMHSLRFSYLNGFNIKF